MSARQSRSAQHGGFLMGMIVGLLVGLGLALGVALYVTKAPNPFITKVPPRSPVQDAAEAERNRNWDPNAPLAGKNPARSASGTTTGLPPAPAPTTAGNPAPPFVSSTPAPRASAPALATAPREAPAATAEPAAPPVAATRPAPTLSTVPGSDPFTYFVQAGAYARPEDAEQQRARLAMLGLQARLTEREQGGRTVYRVRVGPFDHKEEADATKERLGGAGVDAALVRVQK